MFIVKITYSIGFSLLKGSLFHLTYSCLLSTCSSRSRCGSFLISWLRFLSYLSRRMSTYGCTRLSGPSTFRWPFRSRPLAGSSTFRWPFRSRPLAGSSTFRWPFRSRPLAAFSGYILLFSTNGSSGINAINPFTSTYYSSFSGIVSSKWFRIFSRNFWDFSARGSIFRSRPLAGLSTFRWPFRSRPLAGLSTFRWPFRSRPLAGLSTFRWPFRSRPLAGPSTFRWLFRSGPFAGSSTFRWPFRSRPLATSRGYILLFSTNGSTGINAINPFTSTYYSSFSGIVSSKWFRILSRNFWDFSSRGTASLSLRTT